MICRVCNQQKPQDKFTRDKTKKTGYHSICRECSKDSSKNWRKNNLEKAKSIDRAKYQKMKIKNPDQKLNQTLKDRYGISLEDYNKMLLKQNGLCAICKGLEVQKMNNKIKRLYVDHCHITKAVRGLLCSKCNTGLGHFKDNHRIMLNAIDYLIEGEIKNEF